MLAIVCVCLFVFVCLFVCLFVLMALHFVLAQLCSLPTSTAHSSQHVIS